jgi:hypothetical protein
LIFVKVARVAIEARAIIKVAVVFQGRGIIVLSKFPLGCLAFNGVKVFGARLDVLIDLCPIVSDV